MICECGASQWALYVCDDGKYRCWQCRATGRGRVVVHRPNPEARAESKASVARFRRDKNLCLKCARPAQYYGAVGGYSAHCEDCNKAMSEKRRAASKRRRGG